MFISLALFAAAAVSAQVPKVWVDAKIEARKAARAAKDFAKSDALRDELSAMGVEVLDSAEGTRWRVML